MAGLPKKYAKMGFKKGWREYRKVHPKSGKKRKTTTKKKTTKRRSPSRPRPKKGGNKTTTSRKMTQGDIQLAHATGGPALQKLLAFMDDENPKQITDGLPVMYAGYRPSTKELELEGLARGWGGTVNEIGYRKLAQMLHTTPYPSKNSLVENLAMYAKPLMDAWDNQDDIQEAHRLVYLDMHGVDLNDTGYSAYQPLEMLDTKGVLLLVKKIKQFARANGANLPKWI